VSLEELWEYSEQVFRNSGVSKNKVASITYNGKSYHLPVNPYNKRPIVLLPKDVLRDLPIAHSWDDVDRVVAVNRNVRDFVNRVIGRTWKRATRGMKKRAFRELVLKDPSILRNLIEAYKGKPAVQYDFESDPAGQVNWLEASQLF